MPLVLCADGFRLVRRQTQIDERLELSWWRIGLFILPGPHESGYGVGVHCVPMVDVDAVCKSLTWQTTLE
jgi:hypothetical protein